MNERDITIFLPDRETQVVRWTSDPRLRFWRANKHTTCPLIFRTGVLRLPCYTQRCSKKSKVCLGLPTSWFSWTIDPRGQRDGPRRKEKRWRGPVSRREGKGGRRRWVCTRSGEYGHDFLSLSLSLSMLLSQPPFSRIGGQGTGARLPSQQRRQNQS